MTGPSEALRPGRSFRASAAAFIDKLPAPGQNGRVVRTVRNILAASALLWAVPVIPANAALERAQFEAILMAARDYADDRSLIFYCLRSSGETVPFLYAGLQADLEQAVQKMKTAGASARQTAELVQFVLTSVKFHPRDAKYATLDRHCISKDVERSRAEVIGVSIPLFLRPPFDRLGK